VLQGHDRDLTSAPEPIEIQAVQPGAGHCCGNWAPKVADEIRKIDGVVDVPQRH